MFLWSWQVWYPVWPQTWSIRLQRALIFWLPTSTHRDRFVWSVQQDVTFCKALLTENSSVCWQYWCARPPCRCSLHSRICRRIRRGRSSALPRTTGLNTATKRTSNGRCHKHGPDCTVSAGKTTRCEFPIQPITFLVRPFPEGFGVEVGGIKFTA